MKFYLILLIAIIGFLMGYFFSKIKNKFAHYRNQTPNIEENVEIQYEGPVIEINDIKRLGFY